MPSRPFRLRDHLFAIVAIKLVALFAIWWVFVRDARVDVGTGDAASRLLSDPGTQESPQ